MKLYDFGIILFLIALGWMGYGLSKGLTAHDKQREDILKWCKTIDQDSFTYQGVYIECKKENY